MPEESVVQVVDVLEIGLVGVADVRILDLPGGESDHRVLREGGAVLPVLVHEAVHEDRGAVGALELLEPLVVGAAVVAGVLGAVLGRAGGVQVDVAGELALSVLVHAVVHVIHADGDDRVLLGDEGLAGVSEVAAAGVGIGLVRDDVQVAFAGVADAELLEQSFGNETIEAAKAAADANKEDLEHGCGSNFSWNMYVRAGTTSTDAKEDMYAEREAPANANDDYIDVWASGYDAFNPGYGADLDQNNPENVKGTADGKFLSLGKGGSVIVTFTDPLLLDGGEMGEIGSDFIIFANSANNHALAKVEVSSDGETFVAFDTYFTGNGLGESEIFGFAGKFANGKGTKFDLSDLLLKPEVKEGKVDLEAITIIRITDIPGDGSVTDSHGNPIFYPYPAGGFELDAVAAVNELF